MRLLLPLLLLVGCTLTILPVTTSVKGVQDYNMPKQGAILFAVVPRDASPCVTQSLGCVERVGKTFKIWIHEDNKWGAVDDAALQHVFQHEARHIIFGPEHR